MQKLKQLRYKFDMWMRDRLDAALLRISLRHDPIVEYSSEDYLPLDLKDEDLLTGSEIIEDLEPLRIKHVAGLHPSFDARKYARFTFDLYGPVEDRLKGHLQLNPPAAVDK